MSAKGSLGVKDRPHTEALAVYFCELRTRKLYTGHIINAEYNKVKPQKFSFWSQESWERLKSAF